MDSGLNRFKVVCFIMMKKGLMVDKLVIEFLKWYDGISSAKSICNFFVC